MKRATLIISSDSDVDNVDLTKIKNKRGKKLSKNKMTGKGSKRLENNQMSIEASFSKVTQIKRKSDVKADNLITKVAKVVKSELKTETATTTTQLAENTPYIKDPSKTSVSSPISVKSKAAYVQFLHRAGPSALGSKEIPEGGPNSLLGMTFVITGVMDSIERNDAQTLIERCGGKVTKAVSGRTTYLVIGNQPGESKVQKAKKLNIKQIDEDQLFSLIRNNKSNESACSKSFPITQESSISIKSKIESKEKRKPKAVAAPLMPGRNTADNLISCSSLVRSGGSHQLFVDKYCPTTLDQIIGQNGDRSPAKKLLFWLKNFENNLKSDTKANEDGSSFRAALLSGSPGIGKTTTARLVCTQLGYSIVELNASSVRSKNSIKCNLSESLITIPFYNNKGLKHCVIMDEVDGMAGNEDRGGINELIQVIKTTQHPIICICNDRQSRKLQSFAKYVYDIRFRQLTMDQMKTAIVSVVRQERISLDEEIILNIIKSSNYDMRQVLNNLQMWSVGNQEKDTIQRAANNAIKEYKLGPFEVIQKVFSHENVKTLSEKSDLFFQDYQLGGLFVQENYALVRPNLAKGDMCKTMKLMSLATDSIAMGDIVGTKIHAFNNWGLLPTQAIFSSVIPGEYLHGRLTSRIEFPAWLGKFSKVNKNYRILLSLSSHLRLSSKAGVSHPHDISMDYGDLLVKKLCSPLREGDIMTVIENLHTFQLQKEDMDMLTEVLSWSHLANPLSSISSQIKSSLTRAFNKSSFKLPYSIMDLKKSLKTTDAVFNVNDGPNEEVQETEDQDEYTEEGVESDIMIIKKTKPKSTINKVAKRKIVELKKTSKKEIRKGKKMKK